MKKDSLHAAIKLSQKTGFCLLSTADQYGIPHISTTEPICSTGETIRVLAWNCPQSLKNLEVNKKCALVTWDPQTDEGYQIIGEVNQLMRLEMIDGYSKKEENSEIPQVQWRMLIKTEKITNFKRVPHSDTEE